MLATPLATLADDGASAIAAGGLVFKRETRIVMTKEVLTISLGQVIVDYDFRNDTDEDVTTEVAFPIPPYTNHFDEVSAGQQPFSDFRLWIDGKPAAYESQAKATLKGKDITSILVADKIDVASFGHFTFPSAVNASIEDVRVPDIDRLSRDERKRLASLGIFTPGDHSSVDWTVHLQYYWTSLPGSSDQLRAGKRPAYRLLRCTGSQACPAQD